MLLPFSFDTILSRIFELLTVIVCICWHFVTWLQGAVVPMLSVHVVLLLLCCLRPTLHALWLRSSHFDIEVILPVPIAEMVYVTLLIHHFLTMMCVCFSL